MNEHDTTVLTSRLHQLADDMAPTVDVVGQVRAARLRHQKQRRGRIGLIAVATATAAVVLGTSSALDLLSASGGGEVAAPTGTESPATTAPAPSVVPSEPAPDTAPLPAGWEPRSFVGATFGVPPGARHADDVWSDDPRPLFIWYGPDLPDGSVQTITLRLDPSRDTLTVPEEADPVTVRGAQESYVSFVPRFGADPAVVTSVTLVVRTAVGVLDANAYLPAGATGRQMARDLIASMDLTAMDPAAGRGAAGAPSPGPGLGEVAALLTEPVVLTAPDEFRGCPEDPGPLSSAVGTPLAFAGGLVTDQAGCEYRSDVAPRTPQADRLTVSVVLRGSQTLDAMRAEVRTHLEGGDCQAEDVPAVHPDAVLERCPEDSATQWILHVPDSAGRGIWEVVMVFGVNWSGDAGPGALPEVARLAAVSQW